MNQLVFIEIDVLKPNEFKLRQYEMARVVLTSEQLSHAKALVEQGFSKKAVIRVFGCSYKDLKLN